MQALKTNEVKLTAGLFKERERVNRDYLMELESRALLQNFYNEAGIMLPDLQIVEDPDSCYLHWGWEAPTCQLRGHFLGHWMSAAAHLVASNKDRELEAKLLNIVDELKLCQENNGGKWIGSIPEKYFKRLENNAYIWSPQYTLHKTLMGLLDTYEWTGYETAYEILNNAADWYIEWVDSLCDRPLIVNKGEAGGMLEIWARLYGLTHEDKYMKLAKAYSHYGDFDALEKGLDCLTDNHSNASIPEAHGAARMYEITGDTNWLKITEEFWKQAIYDREMYATGGQNAGEFWIAPGHFYESISERTQEFCTMYNMVRLAEYLYRFTGKREYSDFIEKALYNAFLSQQNASTGMVTYFLPQRAGSHKKWSSKRRDFWCCSGTMVQAQTIYTSLIYFKDDNEGLISVDQYINSAASFEINNQKVSISQDVDMDYCTGALFGENDQHTNVKSRWSFVFRINSESEVTIRFRIPAWADGLVYINSEEIRTDEEYYSITRCFENEEIHISFVAKLTSSSLSDGKNVVALSDGPIVLAALNEEGKSFCLGGEAPENVLSPFIEHTYAAYPWQQSSYHAHSANGETVFVPLYEVKDEMYTLYIQK